jgi:hypothetical protein
VPKSPLVRMLVLVVLVALAAEDVVDEGEAATVVAAAWAALPASEMPSRMLPKPIAKLAAVELALLQ